MKYNNVMEVHTLLGDGTTESYYIDRRKVSLVKDTFAYAYIGQPVPALELTVGRRKITVVDSKEKILAWLSGE